MYFNVFLVWFFASLIMLFVFWGTRNWDTTTTTNYSKKAPHIPSDPERELLLKIARLDRECIEMQGVLLEYNTDSTQQIYWDLLAEKTQAEVEYQTRYSHSRKAIKPNAYIV